MSSRTKVILAVTGLVLVGAGVAFAAFGSGGPQVTVEAAEVEQEDLAVSVTASGRVESGVRADIFPPTAGTLEEVVVEEGDTVKAGALLAVMDIEPLELQVAQARAGLAQAESQLAIIAKQEPSSGDIEAARAGTNAAWAGYEAASAAAGEVGSQAPSAGSISAAAAATNAAYAAYSAAKATYDALKASVDASPVPAPASLTSLSAAKVAMDQAYAGYLQAEAAESQLRSYDGSAASEQARAASSQAYAGYLNARAQQRKLEGTSLSAERRAAQAAVDQARAGLAAAENVLVGGRIVAPIDGVVLFNPLGTPGSDGQTPVASDGIAVAPQAAMFTIVEMDELVFVAEVDEVDVRSIEIGMGGAIRLDAFADTPFESTVDRVASAAQPTATGGTVFPVELSLAGADPAILIGMKGDTDIEVSAVPDATTVPIEALFDEGGTAYVYVIENDTLRRARIEVGTITETRVQILSGIEAGQSVALSGPVELVDGMKVRVAEQ